MESLDQQDKELLAKIENKPYRKYTLLDLYPPTRYQSRTEREGISDELQDKLDKMVENGDILVEHRYYSIHAKF